jgi:hypothetical protein
VPRRQLPKLLTNAQEYLLKGQLGRFGDALQFFDKLGVGGTAMSQTKPAFEQHVLPFHTWWQVPAQPREDALQFGFHLLTNLLTYFAVCTAHLDHGNGICCHSITSSLDFRSLGDFGSLDLMPQNLAWQGVGMLFSLND